MTNKAEQLELPFNAYFWLGADGELESLRDMGTLEEKQAEYRQLLDDWLNVRT